MESQPNKVLPFASSRRSTGALPALAWEPQPDPREAHDALRLSASVAEEARVAVGEIREGLTAARARSDEAVTLGRHALDALEQLAAKVKVGLEATRVKIDRQNLKVDQALADLKVKARAVEDVGGQLEGVTRVAAEAQDSLRAFDQRLGTVDARQAQAFELLQQAQAGLRTLTTAAQDRAHEIEAMRQADARTDETVAALRSDVDLLRPVRSHVGLLVKAVSRLQDQARTALGAQAVQGQELADHARTLAEHTVVLEGEALAGQARDEQLASMEARTGAVEDRTRTLSDRLHEQVEALRADLAERTGSLAGHVEAGEGRIEVLEDRTAATEARLAEVDHAAQVAIRPLEVGHRHLHAEVEAVKRRAAEQGGDLEMLRLAVAEVARDRSDLQGLFDKLNREADAADTRLEQLHQEVVRLGTRQAHEGERTEAHATVLAKLERAIAAIREDQAFGRRQIEDQIVAQAERLSGQVAEAVAAAQGDDRSQAALAAVEEVKRQVAELKAEGRGREIVVEVQEALRQASAARAAEGQRVDRLESALVAIERHQAQLARDAADRAAHAQRTQEALAALDGRQRELGKTLAEMAKVLGAAVRSKLFVQDLSQGAGRSPLDGLLAPEPRRDARPAVDPLAALADRLDQATTTHAAAEDDLRGLWDRLLG